MKSIALILLMFGTSVLVSAQDYGATPEIEEKCKQNLSLYREFRNQKLHKDAIGPWRKAVNICPGAAKTLYTDGVTFYRAFIDETEDEATKQLYVDSLLQLYDQRIEYYGEEGFVLGLKGVDIMRYRPEAAKEAEKVLRQSVRLQKYDTDAQILSKFYQTIYELYRQGEADRSDLMIEFMPVLEYIEHNIQNLEDSIQADRYVKARENLYTFFIRIADDCDKVVEILSKTLDENPDDIEQNEKVLKVLNEADCTDSDFFETVATRVYRNAPTHDAAYSLGMRKLKNKEYGEAKKFFDEAAKLCDGCTKMEQYLLRGGQVAIITGNNNEARSYASKILNLNPKSGEALLLHGDAIASSSKACDDGKLGAKSVFWLAVDYYNRAKAADPSVASKADNKIATYSKYFPDKETLFFNVVNEGDSYTVECFGENTKARALK
jgi:tetratricopeptide (TPR) repeat protein